MATARGFSAGGDKTAEVSLPDEVFGIEPNPHVVWESVVNFQANQRHGTAKVKSRGEISRSNSKPWKQKGTGRARAGTWRSPIWIGGGRIHGPQPRDHSYRLPKKIRRLAIKSALSDRANEGRVIVVDSVDVNEPKTKVMWDLLSKMKVSHHKVLILTDDLSENLALSVRNIPNALAMEAREVNAYTVVSSDYVLVTKGGLKQLEEVFA
ncbi:MAG: 50S ribosomal protein L4 [Gemmatimonadetes bacterium]|nr:50S ribosomal protein L4 [Gemmatimonadota bacterium]